MNGDQTQPGPAGQQNPQAKTEQNGPAQQQQQPPNQSAMQQSQNPPQGQRPDIEPEIVKHVREFTYWLPVNGPQQGTPEGDAKIKEMRNSYLVALNKQQKARSRISMLDNMVQQRGKAGQEIPPEIATNKAQMQKEYQAAKDFVDSFREKQKANKAEQDQRRAQQQQQQNPEQSAQQAFAQQQRQNSQPNIKAEPTIKVEGAVSQSTPAQQFGNMQATPQQIQQQQPPSQQGAHPQGQPNMAQQPMRQPPAAISQQHQAQNQHPQFAQPGQPQSHQQPPRPQINPHQANGMPHPQNNSPHPQSATSAGRPIPLSHQDAVSAAQRSYSNNDGPRTGTPMQGQPGQGNFHTPGNREREQMNNPKMPIPRSLNVSAPSPVNMGPARPTISGPSNGAPGPMGQPVIPRFPPFQLEGDSDRVLSKRKLDELVRQVTGGSEEALTPEVEEVRYDYMTKIMEQSITVSPRVN